MDLPSYSRSVWNAPVFSNILIYLVISEQVGVAKPHPDIFEHALAAMGTPARDRVLMVGDNPDSDIVGGHLAGLHTCWLNADNKPTPNYINPHYQVASMAELERKLFNIF